MKKTDTIIRIILTAAFAVVAYLFWAGPYRAVLSYHEQFQLFMFGGPYMLEHMAWPGGLATYVAEFLVQLFNNYWIGALVIALSLLSIQMLTYAISRHYAKLGKHLPSDAKSTATLRYALSFLPAIAMWMLMGDVNYMFSFTIALIVVLLAFWGYTAVNSLIPKCIYIILGTAVVYWIAGAMVYLFAALVAVDLLTSAGRAYLRWIGAVLVLAYTILLVVWSASFLNHPLSQVMEGIGYYRLLDTVTPMMVAVPLIELLTIAACTLLTKILPRQTKRGEDAPHPKVWPAIGAALAIALIGWIGIRCSFDSRIHELTDYDYLIRTNNWNEIIRKAERQSPNTPLTLCATNFALGMTGQLTDRAFQFDQHGVVGLIPTFQRDANSSLVLAEIFYQLGMVNSAQRLTFEAMEAITNYNKSSRCLKRLVETNMIRGDYAVAEKYLRLLDKTMMYRKWAERMRQLINTPGAIDQHPVYGKLRKRQLDEPFLFSETEIDKIMGQLVLRDPENTLATQYLVMYPLMQRDLNKFMQYLEAVQRVAPYYRPVICQQGVAMAYVNAGMDIPQGTIDAPVMRQFSDFAQTMTTGGKDSPSLDRFKNTLWYYLVKQ